MLFEAIKKRFLAADANQTDSFFYRIEQID